MSKNGTRAPKQARTSLAGFVEMRTRVAGVEVELSDGSAATIPPVDLWPTMSEDTPDEEFIVLVLGEEQAARFVADGGTAKMIGSLLAHREELSLPESSASTSS